MGRAVFKLQRQISLLLCGSVDIILDQKHVGTIQRSSPRWNCPFASQNNGEGTRLGEWVIYVKAKVKMGNNFLYDVAF